MDEIKKRCKICNSEDIAVRGKRSYNFCEVHLAEHFKKTREKQQQTLLKKYGVTNPMQIPEIQEKHKQAIEDKYGEGITNVSQVKEIKDKANKTFKKNYTGDKLEELINTRKESYLNNTETKSFNDPKVLEKRRESCLSKYGVDNIAKSPLIQQQRNNYFLTKYGGHPFSLPSTINKRKKDNLEKYGVPHYFQTEEFKNKSLETNLTKYNAPHPMQNKEVKDQARQRYIKKTGFAHPLSNPAIRFRQQYTRRINYWPFLVKELHCKQIQPLFTLDEFLMFKRYYNFHCLRCNKDFQTSGSNIQHIFCDCQLKVSKPEMEIKQWLESLGITNIAQSYRPSVNGRNLEIDLYLEDFKLGIEYNGLYWHSSKFTDCNYHKDKYLHFKQIGIEVVQIFENEWIINKDIVKSIILNKLQLSKKIYARKCTIKEISNNEAISFYNVNHIQGGVYGKVNVGLFYNEELVSAMTISKSRFDKQYDYELIRFASKINTSIIGGFSKLLNYIMKNLNKGETLLTYCDLRYFNGNGYIKNNFTPLRITDPNYFYFKQGSIILETRYSYQKNKLENILPNFNDKLSEFVNMQNNSYYRIYDAGNLKLFLKK